MFHAYIGGILLDSKSVEKTYLVLKGIMDEYLKANATLETFTEHPKVVILDNFMSPMCLYKLIKVTICVRVYMTPVYFNGKNVLGVQLYCMSGKGIASDPLPTN